MQLHYVVIIILLKVSASSLANDEIFRTDIGDQMKIGISDKGYKSVRLRCGADTMSIQLETEDNFDGVIYTRGSFHDQNSPCFLDPVSKDNQKIFKMKFLLSQCNTKKEKDIYSNVLILQHDKELIMPGDAAFNLECDFTKPRDFTVNANLQKDSKVISRITLTDADPASKEPKRKSRSTVENNTNTVILTQKFLQQRAI